MEWLIEVAEIGMLIALIVQNISLREQVTKLGMRFGRVA